MFCRDLVRHMAGRFAHDFKVTQNGVITHAVGLKAFLALPFGKFQNQSQGFLNIVDTDALITRRH